MGALMDLDRPPNSQEGYFYFQLGRAALAIDSIFEEQSLVALQALVCNTFPLSQHDPDALSL